MHGRRRIVFAAECDEAAERVGGYQRIDRSPDAIWDALIRNPYGFPLVASDWFTARYILTRPFEGAPGLLWTFSIDPEGNVTLEHVEEADPY